MKVSLLLFILGTLLITAGYAKQMKPPCSQGIEVKYVPRTVYDEIMQVTAYTESYQTEEEHIDGGIDGELSVWQKKHASKKKEKDKKGKDKKGKDKKGKGGG